MERIREPLSSVSVCAQRLFITGIQFRNQKKGEKQNEGIKITKKKKWIQKLRLKPERERSSHHGYFIHMIL